MPGSSRLNHDSIIASVQRGRSSARIRAIGLPHWWPLVAGFVLLWLLKLLGLEPGQEPEKRAE